MTRAILIALGLFLLALLLALLLLYPLARASAQEHEHPTGTIHGATGQFYETWQRPDMPSSSCCSKADCDIAVDVRQIAGQWWARKRSGGPMTSIPAEKIEQRRDSPDGLSHLCAIGTTVFCFLPAGGT